MGIGEKLIMAGDEPKKAGKDVNSFICEAKSFGFYPGGNLKPREPSEAKNVAKH